MMTAANIGSVRCIAFGYVTAAKRLNGAAAFSRSNRTRAPLSPRPSNSPLKLIKHGDSTTQDNGPVSKGCTTVAL